MAKATHNNAQREAETRSRILALIAAHGRVSEAAIRKLADRDTVRAAVFALDAQQRIKWEAATFSYVRGERR